MRGCARLIGYGIHFLRERKLTARPAPMRRDGKGMHMKKLKTLLCVVFVLATVICLCVSVSAAEEEPTEDWFASFDNTSWKKEPWKTSTTCPKGGSHVPYTEDDSGQIIMGAFGVLVRADVKYENYKIDAQCDHTEGTITLECCKECKTWYISATTVQQKDGNHDWQHCVEAATCIKEGREYEKCTRCGAIQNEKTLPKTDHVYNEVVTKKAACEVEGELTKTCKVCGATVKETIPALAHDYKDNTKDCTTLVCTKCGSKKPSGKQHTITEWEILGDRTPKGTHMGKCTVCGTTVREMHDSIVDDGDCTTPVVCKCGFILVDGSGGHNLIPKFKDDTHPYWDYVVTADGMHSRKCSNPGCDQPTHVDEHKAGEGDCPLCKASAPVTPDETTNEPAADEPKPVEPTVTVEGVAEPATVTAAEAPAVAAKYKDYVAYDIEAEIVGGVAKVSIPIPEGWDNVKVYHVDGDTLTDMNATVVGGNAVFTTNHFSVYAIVNVDTDLDNQNQTSASTDAPATDPAEPTTDAPTTDAPTTDVPTAGAPATDAPATDEPVGGGDIAPAPGDGSVIAPAPETDGETVAPKLGDSDLPMLLTVIAVGAAAAFVSIAAVKKQRGE